MKMKGCTIIANGRAPKKTDVTYFQSLGYKTTICADGGANTAYRLGLDPALIIGDFDSIDPAVLEYFSTRCKLVRYARQNDTDVEKCIKYAIRTHHEKAVILGATGDRLDHSICNLGILLKYRDQINVSMMHECSYLQVLKGRTTLEAVEGETISIYGFDSKTKIQSAGLKYPLKNVALPFGVRESTSNIALSSKVELKLSGGKVFVVRDYKLLRSHGLIS